MNKTTNRIIGIFLLQGDFVFFYAALYIALLFRGMPLPGEFKLLMHPFLYIFLISAFIFFILDFYEISVVRNFICFIRALLAFIVLGSLSGFTYFYANPQIGVTPRAIIILTVIFFAVLSSLWRYLLFAFVGLGNFRKKVVLIGTCSELGEILAGKNPAYEFIGLFSEDPVPPEIREKLPVFDDITKLKHLADQAEIAVFTSHTRKDKNVIEKIFNVLPLDIKYMEFATLYEEIKKKIPLYSVDDWWFLENVSRPRRRLREIITRPIEIILSSAGLLLTVILYPFLASAIKIDSRGPVLYKQQRVGKLEKPFTIYKFRTMAENSEETGPRWSIPGDSRITRLGKIIRKIHVDELPQLYNILKGDISFVGPRPERPCFVEMFKNEIPYYDIRHLEKPGLTGWAQINYPASFSVDQAKEKFKYDLYYIKNRSLLLDIIIILKTIRPIFHLEKFFIETEGVNSG